MIMKVIKTFSLFFALYALLSCVGNMNPTGGNSTPDYPFYITTEAMWVKKIRVPAGTKLLYEEQFMKNGQQDHIMREEKLTEITFPEGSTLDWGGVPISSIMQFFNTDMHGFSVYGAFDKLDPSKKTKFAELWESCSTDIGITVKNTDDWSFNPQNITDVESCSVNYQRYFKADTHQQKFLDEIYQELLQVGRSK